MDDQEFTFKCECCGHDYQPRRNLDGSIGKTRHKLCSVRCQRSVYSKKSYSKRGHDPVRIQRQCATCQAPFVATQSINVYCSTKCLQSSKRERSKVSPIMLESRRARDSRRRAAKRTTTVERIDPTSVFERDRWICHLCGIKTLKSKRGTIHPRAPELEHIISLADGGTHTWGNVACSCSACNRAKGARSFGQLGLGFSC